MLLRAPAGHRVERGLRRRDPGREVVWRDGEVWRGCRRELDLLLDARDVVLVVLEGISLERPSASGFMLGSLGHGRQVATVILLHVTQHGRLEGEFLVAPRVRAGVGLLLGVGLEVGVEISLLGEALLAEAAGVGFLTGVKSHMGDEIALLTEPLVAHLARVGAMRLEMFLERQLLLELDLARAAVEVGRRPFRAAAVTAPARVFASAPAAAAAALVSGSVIA